MEVKGFITKDGYAAVPWGKKLVVIYNGQQLEEFKSEDLAYKFIKTHRNQPKSGTVFVQ